MLLREFFYFDRDTTEPLEDKGYDPSMDKISTMSKDDTRKTRLTLRQINKARKASELHTSEAQKELHFIRQMYGLQATADAGI